MLYFEDLKVGQKFSSEPIIMEQDDMIAFAKRYDPQPFHIDPEAAKQTFFKGLAASGWHTAAVTMRMMVDGWMNAGLTLVGKKIEFIEWRLPVRPNDSLQAIVEILEIFPPLPEKKMGEMRIRTITENQDHTVVMISEALVQAERKRTKTTSP